jgi:hypothetical protein
MRIIRNFMGNSLCHRQTAGAPVIAYGRTRTTKSQPWTFWDYAMTAVLLAIGFGSLFALLSLFN